MGLRGRERMPGSFLTDTERERLRHFPSEVPPEDLGALFHPVGPRPDPGATTEGRPEPARLRAAAMHPPLSGVRARPTALGTSGRHRPSRPSNWEPTPESLCGLWRPPPHADRPLSAGPRPTSASARPGPRDLRALKPGSSPGPSSTTGRPSCFNSPARSSGPTRSCAQARPASSASWSPPGRRPSTRPSGSWRPCCPATARAVLDGLLVPDPARGGTTLAWLRRAASSNSPKAILGCIEKIDFLKRAGVDRLVARRPEPQPAQAAGPGRPPVQRTGPATDAGGTPVSDSWWPSSTSRCRHHRRGDRPVRPLPGRGVMPGRAMTSRSFTTPRPTRSTRWPASSASWPASCSTPRSATPSSDAPSTGRSPTNGSGRPPRNPPGSSAPTTTVDSTSSGNGTATSASSSPHSSRPSSSGRTSTPTPSWRR